MMEGDGYISPEFDLSDSYSDSEPRKKRMRGDSNIDDEEMVALEALRKKW